MVKQKIFLQADKRQTYKLNFSLLELLLQSLSTTYEKKTEEKFQRQTGFSWQNGGKMTHYATMTVEEFTNYKCKFTDDSKLFY